MPKFVHTLSHFVFIVFDHHHCDHPRLHSIRNHTIIAGPVDSRSVPQRLSWSSRSNPWPSDRAHIHFTAASKRSSVGTSAFHRLFHLSPIRHVQLLPTLLRSHALQATSSRFIPTSSHATMPLLDSARDWIDSAIAAPSEVHENASQTLVSLAWTLLIIPSIFVVIAFAWIMYTFSQPSDLSQSNGFSHAGAGDEDDGQGQDEQEKLLDAFNESQSHSATNVTSSASGSSWKINSKFSTTSRGGSVYTSYPDPNGTHTHSPKSSISTSSKSKRSSLTADGIPSRSVGSKAAKVLALNRDRMMQDLEKLDPVDREELQRSSSRASDTRKSD